LTAAALGRRKRDWAIEMIHVGMAHHPTCYYGFVAPAFSERFDFLSESSSMG
jgi:hypothetical protein